MDICWQSNISVFQYAVLLFRLVVTFLPRSKCLLISGLQSPSAVILEAPKIKSDTVATVSPSICHEVMGLNAKILVFWMLSFKPTFYSPLSPSSKGSLVPFHFLPLRWCHLHIWGYWYFSRQSWFQLVLLPAQRFSWYTLNHWILRVQWDLVLFLNFYLLFYCTGSLLLPVVFL